MSDKPFKIVIGLEVHVQLATKSKLFCRCSTQFGAEPNTQTCPVCIGMPGALPVMNREAYRLGLKTALALGLRIPSFTKWDRKSYFYPDLPKGYQISQFDMPMSAEGRLLISDPDGAFTNKRIGIIRAHLEDDAGKSMHDEATGKSDSRIDLNRTGTPLLEIVSEPDMNSPLEARAYLQELKLLLDYLAVSDCNMQEGSLRVDANINLHIDAPDGMVATPIVEVKNMNSFRAVERALEFETGRQWDLWQETGQKIGDVPKQTRGWDDGAQVTRGQRSKEESSDYRYFPDPDLLPVKVTEEEIDAVRAELGELPAQLRERLQASYDLPAFDADVLVNQGRAVVGFFTEVADGCGDGRLTCNWIRQDILRTLNDRQVGIGDLGVSPAGMTGLLTAVKNRDIDTARARDVFNEMVESGEEAAAVMKRLGIEKVDDSALEDLCRELLAANPRVVADLKEGKVKAVGALIGQAKKKNPNVNPGQFRELCIQLAQNE